MSYVVRTYPDVGFVFDVKGQRSFFAEGTASQLVPLFVNDLGAQVPLHHLSEMQEEDKGKFIQDAEFLRREVRSFLEGNECPEEHRGTERKGDSESPFLRLVAYAVREWRIVNVSIEVSYRCNLNCKFCYLSDHCQQGMTQGQYRDLADELYDAGTVFVMFTGGEALLRPDIFDIMADYSDKGFALELKTNGTLMDEKAVEKLSKLNLYSLQVSIYDIGKGQNALVGARYDFEKLSRNIRTAAEAKLPIGLAVLVGKHNVDQLDRIHGVLTCLGVEDIFYSPYITPNRRGGLGFESTLRLSPQEMEEKLLPFLEKIGGLSQPVKYRERCEEGPICFAGHDQIAISPDGSVYPCLDFRVSMGNLKEENLEQVLSRRKELLAPYTLGKVPKCMGCNVAEYCDSCPGTALLEHGDYVTPSQHKCDVSQFNLRSLLLREGGV